MSERIIYLNGDYLAESEAKLPVLDRGLLFADAVYEGFGILDGQIVDFIYLCSVLNARSVNFQSQ